MEKTEMLKGEVQENVEKVQQQAPNEPPPPSPPPPPPPPPPGDNKSFRCWYCNAKLDSNNAVRRHMKFHQEQIEAEMMRIHIEGGGSSHQQPLVSYSEASSSSSRSLPHPGNQAYGESTSPQTPQFLSVMAHQVISGSSHQPLVSYSVGNHGQERINTSILSQARNTAMHQFQSLSDQEFGPENSSIWHLARNIAIHHRLQLFRAQRNTGSSHQPLVSYSSQNFGQETSSNASILPQTQNISMRQFQSLMAQGISGSSHQPLLSNSAVPVRVQGLPSSRSHPNGNFGQESSNNASILPQTQNISMHEFQSLMARGISGPSHQPFLYNSAVPVRVQGLPSSRSHPNGNFGQESRISSIRPQIASIGSASHQQYHNSHQPLVTSSSRSHPSLSYEGSSGQESDSSAIRPQNASIEWRCDKRKFGQERSPADSNADKRLKPLCDDREFDQIRSSSVIVPQNEITEGEGPDYDLNVKPSCNDENSG